jgi:hypothetical protein
MKQTWINIAAIVALIIAFIVISGMVIGKLGSIEIAEHEEQTEPVVVGKPEVIDRRITANDTYELLYKTTYSNGLSVSQWHEVDWDDYIRLWEEG